MTGDGLFLATQALQGRLEAALATSAVPGHVFVGPLDEPEATGAVLILFLYRVVPSATQRNREHRVASGDAASPVRVVRNALPLDLYYLVTLGRKQGAGEDSYLRALGHVMQAFQADPLLTGPGLADEPATVTLEPLTTEEASRIWALFPTANYRTSIAYLATPVWIDPAAPDRAGPPVLEDQLRAGPRLQEARP